MERTIVIKFSFLLIYILPFINTFNQTKTKLMNPLSLIPYYEMDKFSYCKNENVMKHAIWNPVN